MNRPSRSRLFHFTKQVRSNDRYCSILNQRARNRVSDEKYGMGCKV
ncbi:MAG: hypothetical protein JGK40_01780 [Microcoleus sp. PH2017_21_RUC_O_A]|nr:MULTISPECIES: hypothetical protein [unclassified Microcoleus]MCC3526829.1 hypothetical protein [Microcoleus sp. PH2017_21_RUC_O_A]